MCDKSSDRPLLHRKIFRPANVFEHPEMLKSLNGARGTQARELATKCLESSSPRICPFPAQRVSGASASRAVALVRLQTPAIVWRRTRAAEPKSGLCAEEIAAASSNACLDRRDKKTTRARYDDATKSLHLWNSCLNSTIHYVGGPPISFRKPNDF